jgi:hypothetical protein
MKTPATMQSGAGFFVMICKAMGSDGRWCRRNFFVIVPFWAAVDTGGGESGVEFGGISVEEVLHHGIEA